MENQRDILVFAGPSGVGKSTLYKMMLHQFPDRLDFAISATTRPIRIGEVDGKDYYFLSEKDFKQKVESGDFIEHEEVYPGRWYGTLASEIDRVKSLDKIILLDVDVLGAINIKKIYGQQALIVFIKPESIEALEERLRSRGSESKEEILIRVARFKKELSYEKDFDEVVVNETNKLDNSRTQLEEIISNNF